MPIACIICNDTLEQNPTCELFPFPDKALQPVQYQRYLIVCDLSASTIPADEQLYICSTHFTPECFQESAAHQRTLLDGAVPSLNMERIEYIDDDIQMLDEYIPLYNAEQHQGPSTSGTSTTTVQPMLVPKAEPVETLEEAMEDIPFVATEVKTEAPEADESTPDPFGNIEPGPSTDPNRFCILCNAREGTTPDCRLYVFPRKIPNIYRKWIQAAQLEASQYKGRDIYSCQRHFPENGFFANGRFIQSWATPKLNLPPRKKQPAATTPARKPVILNRQIAKLSDSTRGVEVNTIATETVISSPDEAGPKIVIKHNPANRKNAETLNIDPDHYAKVFSRVVTELVPKTLNYNGEQRPVTGTIVFSSNLF
uniref:THAP-type domain-containing protein n=1 Tax=Culex tarsalis TaxID=7177 RepID=A0A1Q3F1S6_CULTA